MNPNENDVLDDDEDDEDEEESVLSQWEPAGLLASIFFIVLPAITAVLLAPFSIYLLVLWAVWAIYLAVRGTGINRMAGTRLLVGCILGFLYLIFLAPPAPLPGK